MAAHLNRARPNRMARVTDRRSYARRRLLAGTLGLSLLGGFGALRYGGRFTARAGDAIKPGSAQPQAGLAADDNSAAVDDPATRRLTLKHAATHYNNAYEFGWDKTDPHRRSGKFKLEPWAVTFDGLCRRPGTFGVDDLMGMPFSHLEERIYDFRCVEAWSMVIPYNGRPLRDLIEAVEPMTSARYVAFTSVLRPDEMPGQASPFSSLDWPYVEALTIEEAVHPLTFATFGVYGDRSLPQNGMPLRITVPWKYGFKSAKFIVRITFTEQRPAATWHLETPSEYGWYSNVYPSISHPRWSQATERRIWGDGKIERIPSRPYNGYAEQVAHLYPGSKQQYR